MSSPKVLVIGCGVSGPVVACFLKQKGYEPIIFERVESPGDVGASLMICPNGLKVLERVGPIPDKLLENGPPVLELCDHKASGEVLGGSDIPTAFAKRYGQPAVGVKRTLITSWLRDAAEEKGIELRRGWALERIEESNDSITAFFEGGKSEIGSFLIGCDGLKATTRKLLLARAGLQDGLPSFTGLTQTAGVSPTPDAFRGRPGARNWYGELSHVICYDMTHDKTSWALTLPGEAVEEASWGLFGDEQRAAAKKAISAALEAKGWDPVVLGLVNSAERLIKYGIYDRPELSPEQWYSGRCVMIGDAVHPTSVHLGQGANQSCEDCYFLAEAIPDFDHTKPLSTEQLSSIFKSFAEKQQPHTSVLVNGARALGRARVAPPEACVQRDAAIAQSMADRAGLQAKFDFTYSRPFQRPS
ncbi:salicylate hydroxylase [Colletotrichum higginsianum]|nr:salicylate hydroxylase [Colletotrichum higginsianum]